MLDVLNPDLGQAMVHRPLQPIRGILHLRLDGVPVNVVPVTGVWATSTSCPSRVGFSP
jgi:hypothetical protein